MNEYKFDDLKIGQTETFSYTVTDDAMRSFYLLTGDVNPLHMDEKFAKAHGFKANVVYGMLTASLISTLAGVYLPGKYCLVQQVETKFSAPVYVDDTLSIVGEVKALYEEVKRAEIKVTIFNQENKKVVRGFISVGFLE